MIGPLARLGLALGLAACSGSPVEHGHVQLTAAGAGGRPVALVGGAGPLPAGQGALVAPQAGRLAPAADGGTRASAAGAAGVPAPAGQVAPAPALGPATAAGSGTSASHDHCQDGEPADPRDALLTDQPDTWQSPSGAIDLVVPEPVLRWMGERIWEPSHDAWHNVRRCQGRSSGGLCARPELVPDHQECADAEDGYQFLVMHRHMLRALAQAFPQHASLFQGFARFPFEAKDVPVAWQDRWGSGWSAKIKETATALEDIENQLDRFASEGELGRFIQCGGMANGASSIHGALHFKWVVSDSPYSLGKQTVNIDNYMFWKLHGWIDGIWERYRVAKGLAADEPKLRAALVAQCTEMHTLGHALEPGASKPTQPLPEERGVFHEQVRPILERTCASCHSESSPEAGLSLGGQISSAEIVKGLVGVAAVRGTPYLRVVAGEPSQSWLYLKASGMAQSVGCTGSMCNTQVMPPTGDVTLTQRELESIAQWIRDGAAAPTP